jgi:hypothetical protein
MKPWRTADARIGSAALFAKSITEQVEARRALADTEARFRVTFENAPVGIGLVAPVGCLRPFVASRVTNPAAVGIAPRGIQSRSCMGLPFCDQDSSRGWYVLRP